MDNMIADIKLNKIGSLEWQKLMVDRGMNLRILLPQTKDSGYIFTGWTSSTDGDVTNKHGYSDIWVVKLNSIGTLEWQKLMED